MRALAASVCLLIPSLRMAGGSWCCHPPGLEVLHEPSMQTAPPTPVTISPSPHCLFHEDMSEFPLSSLLSYPSLSDSLTRCPITFCSYEFCESALSARVTICSSAENSSPKFLLGHISRTAPTTPPALLCSYALSLLEIIYFCVLFWGAFPSFLIAGTDSTRFAQLN